MCALRMQSSMRKLTYMQIVWVQYLPMYFNQVSLPHPFLFFGLIVIPVLGAQVWRLWEVLNNKAVDFSLVIYSFGYQSQCTYLNLRRTYS
jgi:hypothetical protein